MFRRRITLASLLLLAALPAWAQQNPSFNLVNRAGSVINEAYATPAGQSNWGQDKLGSNSIQPGQSFPIRLPADGNCIYDVRVVYANGQADERRNLNTCTIDNVTFPANAGGGGGGGGNRNGQNQGTTDPSFRLINRGRSPVNEVYATAAGVDNWGQDRLGNEVVGIGSTRVIRLPAGNCVYDVRVVFANGQSSEKRRVNLCNITDLSVP